MKILMEVSTYSCKTYHSLAKRIKEIYPGTQFGIVRGPAKALSFLREQNDIKYEIFEENDNYSFTDSIDCDDLKNFHVYLPNKSICRISGFEPHEQRSFLRTKLLLNITKFSNQFFNSLLNFSIKTFFYTSFNLYLKISANSDNVQFSV